MQPHDVLLVLNDPLSQKLLNAPIPAHLAYIATDGTPRVIPVGFLWNGSEIVVCTATGMPKVKALSRNPKVALTIDTDTDPPRQLLVRGTARIEIVVGVPSEYLEAAKKSVAVRDWSAFETSVRAMYPQMARIRIAPEWAKLIDFERTLPSELERLAKHLPAGPGGG